MSPLEDVANGAASDQILPVHSSPQDVRVDVIDLRRQSIELVPFRVVGEAAEFCSTVEALIVLVEDYGLSLSDC